MPIQSTYLQGVTIWGNARNLFTLTRYTGLNPEVSIGGSSTTPGVDNGNYPISRTYTLGLNVTF